MKKIYLPLLLLLISRISFSQAGILEACVGENFSNDYLHANEVRASVSNIGVLFFDGDLGFYQVPYHPDSSSLAVVSINGLWLGAKDEAGNKKVAAVNYSVANGRTDFWPGPLDSVGMTDVSHCEKWNRIWTVRRQEIEAHLKEYFTEGVVAQPPFSLLSWPGAGNPYFQQAMGFSLPGSPQGLAPFYDWNGDGVYDPVQGDYPLPEGVETIPGQILWAVFNDEGGGAIHGETEGQAMRAEVHFTAWAFDCADNPLLNRTIFASYKVINRSSETLDSMHIGLYQDSDLGCYLDDGAGCSESLDSYFYYALGDTSIACGFPIYSSKAIPSVTLLNKKLTHFVVLDPACSSPLFTGPHYYDILDGVTYNGPLTYGENGCNPDNPPTPLAYPGNPENPLEWSMVSANVSGFDVRSVASTLAGTLHPGDYAVLDIAFGYHHQFNESSFQNLPVMYDEVAQIRDMYGQHFGDVCMPVECSLDCVWPGDANKDGIANYRDLLSIGLSLNKTGPERLDPRYYWAPFCGDDWTDNLPGHPNQKHSDCNGDGVVGPEDYKLTNINYGLTVPEYQAPPDVYPQGPEIYFEVAGLADPDDLEPEQTVFLWVKIKNVPDLFGLAFQVEYDKRYFDEFDNTVGTLEIGPQQIRTSRQANKVAILDQVDLAMICKDGGLVIPEGILTTFILKTSTFPYPLNSNQTKIRIKNIMAVREDGTLMDIGAYDIVLTFPGIATSDTKETAFNEKLVAFPNPASDLLTVSIQDEGLDGIWLYDMFGQLVLSRELFHADEWTGGVGHLPPGFYALVAKSGEKMARKKLILSR